MTDAGLPPIVKTVADWVLGVVVEWRPRQRPALELHHRSPLTPNADLSQPLAAAWRAAQSLCAARSKVDWA